VTQIVHVPRSAWLANFRRARAAGIKSREARRKAEQRHQAELRRSEEATPQLRKPRRETTPT
jgi:hypothetical protein